MRRAAQVVYGLFAFLGIVGGLAAIIRPGLALPQGEATGVSSHLMREEGALFVFVGLMCLWCTRHFDQRRPVHFSLMTFTLLFALIHWRSVVLGGGYAGAAIVNTIPVLLLAATAPWARSTVSS